ncbi:ubiquitin activating enzyme [Babesia caballi]|uniref:SUMO-activating enzyme subunit n=1 Tax=Babesia caballi TaxID=5871 RepID=A0AAV4M351_BABCB|nr:ubiquitin activating enzyme [Babesia caballi]
MLRRPQTKTRRAELDDCLDVLRDASVLLVGAGGIGCEVIKNLVLCGLRKLVIVDMDTIDVSNLNRQFLYQRHHVKLHKATVACERAREAAPDCDVSAKVCDVTEWGPQDVAPYDAVLNALDNVRARSHINYCCMHAGWLTLALCCVHFRSGVPLIESGSTGFNGQVYPIVHGVTPCYDCHEKPRNKSIPVCTIRQIPEKPEHCIAWARQLYELLFGQADSSNLLNDLAISPIPDAETVTERDARAWARGTFAFLFNRQITDLLSLTETWKGRREPVPLSYPFSDDDESCDGAVGNGSGGKEPLEVGGETRQAKMRRVEGQAAKASTGNSPTTVSQPVTPLQLDEASDRHEHGIHDKMRIYDVDELAAQFRDCVVRYLLDRQRHRVLGSAVFDKDDPLCVQFVAAAANLRMINFHIPQLSAWDVQSIAGSITPAIAATNAIVGASQVMQLIHLLRARRAAGGPLSREAFDQSRCRFVWVKACVTGSAPLQKGALCSPETLEGPNPNCTVCQMKLARVELRAVEDWTLASFASLICEGRMGMKQVNLDFDNRNVLDSEIFEEEPEYAQRIREQAMTFYGIGHQSILTVTCLDSGRQVDLQLLVDSSLQQGEFRLIGFD